MCQEDIHFLKLRCENSSSHISVTVESSLLGCYTVSTGWVCPDFWKGLRSLDMSGNTHRRRVTCQWIFKPQCFQKPRAFESVTHSDISLLYFHVLPRCCSLSPVTSWLKNAMVFCWTTGRKYTYFTFLRLHIQHCILFECGVLDFVSFSVSFLILQYYYYYYYCG